jgi:UDPglucose 6-dehydrogenase
MIDALLKAGVSVAAYDPEAMGNVRQLLGENIAFGKDPYEILEGADFLIIATEWSVFRTPEFDRMKSLMNQTVIFDGRNLYDLQRMKEKGFTYYSIGRDVVTP